MENVINSYSISNSNFEKDAALFPLVYAETTFLPTELTNSRVFVQQRNQANARERDRTQNVNSAFSVLRGLIPTEPRDRKLSKIEILRLAGSYISHLQNQLDAGSCPTKLPCIDRSDLKSSRHNVCTFCMSLIKKEKTSPKPSLVYNCHKFPANSF